MKRNEKIIPLGSNNASNTGNVKEMEMETSDSDSESNSDSDIDQPIITNACVQTTDGQGSEEVSKFHCPYRVFALWLH